jgi:hypothetical protein
MKFVTFSSGRTQQPSHKKTLKLDLTPQAYELLLKLRTGPSDYPHTKSMLDVLLQGLSLHNIAPPDNATRILKANPNILERLQFWRNYMDTMLIQRKKRS